MEIRSMKLLKRSMNLSELIDDLSDTKYIYACVNFNDTIDLRV